MISQFGDRANTTFTHKNFDKDYKSRYPTGLNLNPDSETHKKLVKFLLEQIHASATEMEKRYPVWKQLDQKLTSYVELSGDDKVVNKADKSKPVTIVIPQSYATREVLLTYMTTAFLRDPLFQYLPSDDPNDEISVMILESLVNQQSRRRRMGLNLHTMWSDDITYSVGGVSIAWEKVMGRRTRKGSVKEVVKYEGNRLYNFDPYNMYPDISRPITQVEDHTYFGFCERSNYRKLRNLEVTDESYFNVQYLEDFADSGISKYYNETTMSGRNDKTGLSLNMQGSGQMKSAIDVLWVYAFFVPKTLGLGQETVPELWKFGLAMDRVLISAERMELDHGHIPIAIESMKTDGHSILGPSILEIEYPIQSAIDWLWGSHVANVRKAVNNMLVVDPSLINVNDLMDSKSGMIARLRARAWGKNQLDQAVMQLKVTDITQGHVGDIGFLKHMSDQSIGTSDQLRGIQERKGERVSSAEAMGTRTSALSRREKDAKIAAMQSMYEIAYQMGCNTLQFMEGQRAIEILGDRAQQLIDNYPNMITITGTGRVLIESVLDELDMDFDVNIQDGTIPVGENAETWQRLLEVSLAHPDLMQNLDYVKVWKHIAEQLGARSPEKFMKVAPNTKMQPDEEVSRQAQAGNIAPIGEVING